MLPNILAPACWKCEASCIDWIENHTYVNGYKSDDDTVRIWAHCLFDQDSQKYPRFKSTHDLFDKWPGFTTVDDQWVIPQDLKININITGKLPWGKDGIKLLEHSLKEAGINIFSEVQLTNKDI